MNFRITALVDPNDTATSRTLVWLASGADAIPVGSAFLRLFTAAGQDHLAELTVSVHPAHRREHVGSALSQEAIAGARGAARRAIIGQAEEGSPGEKFAAAMGFRRVLALIYSRLSLASADIEAITRIALQPHPGYRLVSWDGPVPDALAETFVASRRAMDDMPMGASDFGTVTWDLDRVLAAAAAVERRGEHLHTVAAISETDGTIAAFSELVVPADGSGDAQHYGTGVLPEHRGQGLGQWMKASAILHAREHYPELAGLLTDTADSNAPMMRINETLGYRPTNTTHEHQLDL